MVSLSGAFCMQMAVYAGGTSRFTDSRFEPEGEKSFVSHALTSTGSKFVQPFVELRLPATSEPVPLHFPKLHSRQSHSSNNERGKGYIRDFFFLSVIFCLTPLMSF